jgi:hypothetical protein
MKQSSSFRFWLAIHLNTIGLWCIGISFRLVGVNTRQRPFVVRSMPKDYWDAGWKIEAIPPHCEHIFENLAKRD